VKIKLSVPAYIEIMPDEIEAAIENHHEHWKEGDSYPTKESGDPIAVVDLVAAVQRTDPEIRIIVGDVNDFEAATFDDALTEEQWIDLDMDDEV